MSAISSVSYLSLPVAAEVIGGAVYEINETALGLWMLFVRKFVNFVYFVTNQYQASTARWGQQ